MCPGMVLGALGWLYVPWGDVINPKLVLCALGSLCALEWFDGFMCPAVVSCAMQ